MYALARVSSIPGFDWTARNRDGMNMVDVARLYGHEEILDWLLAQPHDWEGMLGSFSSCMLGKEGTQLVVELLNWLLPVAALWCLSSARSMS